MAREGARVIVTSSNSGVQYDREMIALRKPGGGNRPADRLREVRLDHAGEFGGALENYEKAYKKARQLWTAGDWYYISAGSDVHDVWAKRSGMIRMYAKLDGSVTAESFAASMKQGDSIATMGPWSIPIRCSARPCRSRPAPPPSSASR